MNRMVLRLLPSLAACGIFTFLTAHDITSKDYSFAAFDGVALLISWCLIAANIVLVRRRIRKCGL